MKFLNTKSPDNEYQDFKILIVKRIIKNVRIFWYKDLYRFL